MAVVTITISGEPPLPPRLLTFQDVDGGAIVSFLDDAAALGQAGGVHAVHDGDYLRTQSDV